MAIADGRTPPQIVTDLVNHVARAFYEPIHAVILNALVVHREPFREDFLCTYLDLPHATVVKCLRFLERELFIFHFTKTEDGKDNEFYCIHFDVFIDVVRQRLMRVLQWVWNQDAQKVMAYYCQKCNQGYNEFELQKLRQGHSFICSVPNCGGTVTEDEDEFRERTGSDVPLKTLFPRQLGHITTLLEHCKGFVVDMTRRHDVNRICTIAESQRIEAHQQRDLQDMRFAGPDGIADGGSLGTGSGMQWNSTARDWLKEGKGRLLVEIVDEESRLREKRLDSGDPDENDPMFLRDPDVGPDMVRRRTSASAGASGSATAGGAASSALMMIDEEELDERKAIANFWRIARSREQSRSQPGSGPLSVAVVDEEGDVSMVDDGELDEYAVWVNVCGRQKRLAEISEEDEERMTDYEYEQYQRLFVEQPVD